MTILTSTVSILTLPGRKSFRAEVTLGAEAEKSLKQKCHSGFECFMRSFKVTEVNKVNIVDMPLADLDGKGLCMFLRFVAKI